MKLLVGPYDASFGCGVTWSHQQNSKPQARVKVLFLKGLYFSSSLFCAKFQRGLLQGRLPCSLLEKLGATWLALTMAKPRLQR
jgi:hypothetical protein